MDIVYNQSKASYSKNSQDAKLPTTIQKNELSELLLNNGLLRTNYLRELNAKLPTTARVFPA